MTRNEKTEWCARTAPDCLVVRRVARAFGSLTRSTPKRVSSRFTIRGGIAECDTLTHTTIPAKREAMK